MRFKWQFNWKILAFALLFLPVLLSLGFWQLDRAAEKAQLLAFIEQQQAKPPLDWQAYQKISPQKFEEPTRMATAYRLFTVTGRFETERYWLLENQIWQGQIGYHVIAPFYVQAHLDQQADEKKGHWLLVDRGWVPSTGYRDQPPEVSFPSAVVTLEGAITESYNHALLDNAEQSETTWPRLILQIDSESLAQQFGETEPFQPPLVMRLSQTDPNAFIVSPQSVNMPPSKHIGYATQWFALAVTLVVLSIFANSNLAELIKGRKKSPHE